MSIELASLRVKVIRLKAARLKDAVDHERAMRAMIRMLAKRGDVISNLKERADKWQAKAIRLNARNISLRLKNDRINKEFLREVGKIKESSYES